MKTIFKGLLVITLVALTTGNAPATDAIVKTRTGLRVEPSAAHIPIMILDAQESVDLLDPSPAYGYYHVRTADGEEGWIYSRFLEIMPSPASPG